MGMDLDGVANPRLRRRETAVGLELPIVGMTEEMIDEGGCELRIYMDSRDVACLKGTGKLIRQERK
jgi:hypothetical protein